MSPVVSIIIPTYNRAWALRRALDSVFQQSYEEYEVIIVDDGSRDGTKELFAQMKSKKIKYVKQRHKGVSAARNLGIKQAQGALIAFLDSDDEWKKDKLQVQIAFMEKNPDKLLVQGNELWVRNGKRVNPKNRHQKENGLFFEKALRTCLVTTSSLLCRRELFEIVGVFDKALFACEDYDFYLRVLARDIPIPLIPEILLTRYGGHQDQLSVAFPAMDRFRITALLKLLKEEISWGKRKQIKTVLKQKVTILYNGSKKRKKIIAQYNYKKILKKLK